jgi:hypothetical protein
LWTTSGHWEAAGVAVDVLSLSPTSLRVLNINEPSRVMLRENLFFEGRFPSDE